VVIRECWRVDDVKECVRGLWEGKVKLMDM
jgi:hypothetical protein